MHLHKRLDASVRMASFIKKYTERTEGAFREVREIFCDMERNYLGKVPQEEEMVLAVIRGVSEGPSLATIAPRGILVTIDNLQVYERKKG